MPNRNKLLDENYKIQDDLEQLGIKREYVDLEKMSDERLAEFVEEKRAQLAQRKKWLGVTLGIVK